MFQCLCVHWKPIVIIMPGLSSLAAPQIAVTTTCSAASDDKSWFQYGRVFITWGYQHSPDQRNAKDHIHGLHRRSYILYQNSEKHWLFSTAKNEMVYNYKQRIMKCSLCNNILQICNHSVKVQLCDVFKNWILVAHHLFDKMVSSKQLCYTHVWTGRYLLWGRLADDNWTFVWLGLPSSTVMYRSH